MTIPLDRLILALEVIVGVPLALVLYVYLVELLMRVLPFKIARRVRPWLWIAPVLAFLTVYLIYPALQTAYLSFYNADSSEPVGLGNYVQIFTSSDLIIVLRNNALWLVFLTLLTVTFGLLMAVLFDRVPYESAAKAIVFLPMAISFVAAGIIWKLMYDYRSPPQPQAGTLNAVLVSLGGQPIPWLIDQTTNNPALIWVGVWMWTGFGMVVLSAALKSIPDEVLEAARVDGATELQVLRFVTIPMMSSTIAVVATTMIIFALKAFDVVYVLTSGRFNTDVIGNRMWREMYVFKDFGRASAIAVVLLLAIIPVMVINIRRFREQEATR